MTTQTGDWIGADVGVPPAYPMTPGPFGGYGPEAPKEVTDCDTIFTDMLRNLDDAWSGGGDAKLSSAIDSMDSLNALIIGLFKKSIPRREAGLFGPEFRKAADAAK